MDRQRKTKSLIRRVNRKGHPVKDFFRKYLFLVITLFFLLIILISGAVVVAVSPETKNIIIIPTISNEVLSYKDIVTQEMINHGVPVEYEAWILAQMQQESKGKGADPMQASENKYERIAAIQSPEESIAWGIGVWREHMTLIQELGLKETPELLLQSYNFGKGYLKWLKKMGYEGYTPENALEYSIIMSEGLDENLYRAVNVNKAARYGDYLYVEHVKRFLN